MIIITTTNLPNGTIGVAYSQAIATSGGASPYVFTVDSGALPSGLSLGSGTGLISGTPNATGTYSFVVEVTDDNSDVATKAYTISVYDPLVITPQPEPGDTAIFTAVGDQIQFSAVGGSGNYTWSVDGGNLINPVTGLFTALGGGTATVTVVDNTSGQISISTVVIASQSQFCVTAAPVGSASELESPCCELNAECGQSVQLRVPSFFIYEDGHKASVQYETFIQSVPGDASALQSRAAGAGAAANRVSFTRNAFYEIATSFDMAQTGNGEFAIGWSNVVVDAAASSIKHAVVWYTDAGVRKVEVRNFGVAEAGSDFAISQGDVVTFGVINGTLQLWINSILQFTSSADPSTCGDMILAVAIADANKTIGGFVSNLAWSITTPGTAGQVGSVNATGVYTSPSNPIPGVVQVVGSINNANFFVNIRNIQPTPMYSKPNAILAGRKAHVWVTNQRATDNGIIRLASDGTPDALQNPNMIYLGVLQESATFAEEITRQDFTNDDGIYYTSIASESATLTGTFLEVRDLDKLATLMTHATLYPTQNGVRELGVGGKACAGCDLRAVLIVETADCGGGWDVIYMPKVQNNGNLSLELGRTTNANYPFSLRVLPDQTRSAGRQLYSIYQMQNCTSDDGGTSCNPAFPNLTPPVAPLPDDSSESSD